MDPGTGSKALPLHPCPNLMIYTLGPAVTSRACDLALRAVQREASLGGGFLAHLGCAPKGRGVAVRCRARGWRLLIHAVQRAQPVQRPFPGLRKAGLCLCRAGPLPHKPAASSLSSCRGTG